jgi:hypothetical protein
MRQKTFIIILVISIGLSVLPYIAAAALAGDGHVFEGFLLNPIDGNSYLAKMHLGWDGEWIFTLPYTANPGNGGYLFLFYIALGHLARLFNLPLIAVFHLARVAASIFLIFTLYKFCEYCFKENPKWISRSFTWICLGAGLGWVLFPAGIVTSDLIVPEAFTFLSDYVNPHFPIGLALLIWVFIWSLREETKYRIFVFLSGLGLAIVLPFGMVIALAVLLIMMIWTRVEQKKLLWKNPFFLFLGGGPFLIYQYWISVTDPVLAGWNAQNQTPSPAWWDLLVTFSPALIVAVLVFVRWRVFKPNGFQKISLAWFTSSLVLIVFPFALQRRFLLGFSIPTIILATSAIPLIWPSIKIQKRIFNTALAASFPSILVILLLAGFGISRRDARLYMTAGEMKALAWIVENTPSKAVILAAPDTGNLIPAQTGRRVIYGHPFETVNAETQKQLVVDLFSGTYSATESLSLAKENGIQYVFFGPREKEVGNPAFLAQMKPIFSDSDVNIYSLTR